MARVVIRGRRTFGALAVAAIVAGTAVACVSDGVLGISSSTTFAPGTALHSMEVGSLERDYVLHIPAHRPMASSGTLLPYPLIIVLHGSSGTGEDIRETTNMDSIGEANRTIVAYPNGVRGAGGLFPTDWNAGTCCGAAGRENIDDVAFIASVIAQLSSNLPIDKRRIYVAGFSDGARMAYHLACAMATQIAAIGVVSGSIKDDDCVPSRAVPVIAVHGTDDPTVPFDEESLTPFSQPVDDIAATLPPSVQFWVVRDGCGGGVTTAFSAHVDRTSFSTCTGAEVAFYSIAGGVHTWPVLTDAASDDPDATFAATALIGQFFRRKALK